MKLLWHLLSFRGPFQKLEPKVRVGKTLNVQLSVSERVLRVDFIEIIAHICI